MNESFTGLNCLGSIMVFALVYAFFWVWLIGFATRADKGMKRLNKDRIEMGLDKNFK